MSIDAMPIHAMPIHAMSVGAVSGSVPTVPIIATVLVLAVVQSVFGVGLLLFGTPTLLLWGIPFEMVLGYLLPCSIVVSALQLADSGGLSLEPIRRQFLLYTAPAVLLATGVALVFGKPDQLRVSVGVMLLATAALRVGPLRGKLAGFVRNRTRPLMVLLGIVHGLSNLGGGILTTIVASNFADKAAVRRQIAFAYGSMALIQLTVVLIVARPSLHPMLSISLPLLAGTTYLLLGRQAFARASQRRYEFGLTGLILSFGLILVATT
jgi:hypothetical protein